MICIPNTPEIDELRRQYNKKYKDNMTEHQFIALLEAMMSRYSAKSIPDNLSAINKYYKEQRQRDAEMERLMKQPKYYEQGFSPAQSPSNQQSLYAQEQNREMEEIKQRAIADGTFMKAPNGKKSNLNERQWLQVRTKAFKEWFGDWIGNPFAKTVSLGVGTFNADNADMSGYRPEFPFFVDGNFAGSFHFENLVINRDGENITDDKYLTFPEVGWALELEPEFRGKGYGKAMYYEAAKVAARKGRSLRSASLSNMSDDAKHVWESLVKNGYAKLEDNHYVFNNEKLNYSKVIDENGEPLVAYHYSKSKFDTFKVGENSAIYFSSDEEYAKSYGNVAYAVFLNIKRPEDISVEYKDGKYYYKGEQITYRAYVEDFELSHKRVSELVYFGARGVHDGVIGNDAPYDDGLNENHSNGVEYVIFNPNQVKSATDNNGKFSTTDNNIRRSSRTEAPSVAAMVDRAPLDEQSSIINNINNGNISISCR